MSEIQVRPIITKDRPLKRIFVTLMADALDKDVENTKHYFNLK